MTTSHRPFWAYRVSHLESEIDDGSSTWQHPIAGLSTAGADSGPAESVNSDATRTEPIWAATTSGWERDWESSRDFLSGGTVQDAVNIAVGVGVVNRCQVQWPLAGHLHGHDAKRDFPLGVQYPVAEPPGQSPDRHDQDYAQGDHQPCTVAPAGGHLRAPLGRVVYRDVALAGRRVDAVSGIALGGQRGVTDARMRCALGELVIVCMSAPSQLPCLDAEHPGVARLKSDVKCHTRQRRVSYGRPMSAAGRLWWAFNSRGRAPRAALLTRNMIGSYQEKVRV